MKEKNQLAYYAIIPSEVRYCEELKYAERLLYGEITALTGKEGYCFATNRYFSELYHVIPETISRWISHLEKLRFICVEIIKDDKKQVIERRIYINEVYERNLSNTYWQNKQYPYRQNEQYPIGRKAKENNINIRIDRFFNYIIGIDVKNSENLTKDEQIEFLGVLKNLELNYTEEVINIFTDENKEKLKVIIYALKELFISNKKQLITKARRNNLLFVYDNCKKREIEHCNTENEISNFFEYYYISLVRELEKQGGVK